MSRPNIDPIEYLKNDLKIYSPLLKELIPLSQVADISGFYKEQQKSFKEMSLVIVFAVFPHSQIIFRNVELSNAPKHRDYVRIFLAKP